MAVRTKPGKPISLRKLPAQARSVETVAVVLEAAARILEHKGFEGFNTNAVAERAGVSIGSLYQYFPNKDALLSKLIQREYAPMLEACDRLALKRTCRAALKEYVQISVRHQMKRPKLAMLIDIAEKREVFHHEVSETQSRLLIILNAILQKPGAPRIRNLSHASSDVLVIVRSLVDAAGERGETESAEFLLRVEGALWGYLRSTQIFQE